MYQEFYGLRQAPFDITPNPRFLFHSTKHREAFNHLLYGGVRERKGFVQLTGEVGAGKTTLCPPPFWNSSMASFPPPLFSTPS